MWWLSEAKRRRGSIEAWCVARGATQPLSTKPTDIVIAIALARRRPCTSEHRRMPRSFERTNTFIPCFFLYCSTATDGPWDTRFVTVMVTFVLTQTFFPPFCCRTNQNRQGHYDNSHGTHRGMWTQSITLGVETQVIDREIFVTGTDWKHHRTIEFPSFTIKMFWSLHHSFI